MEGKSAVMGVRERGEGKGCGRGPEGAVKGLPCVSLRWGAREPTGAIKFREQNTLMGQVGA